MDNGPWSASWDPVGPGVKLGAFQVPVQLWPGPDPSELLESEAGWDWSVSSD